jgi:hypothetical protein
MTTYTITTVWDDEARGICTQQIATMSNKIIAMQLAKKLAKGGRGGRVSDCMTYGPSSLAYYGEDITAVVAWR